MGSKQKRQIARLRHHNDCLAVAVMINCARMIHRQREALAGLSDRCRNSEQIAVARGDELTDLHRRLEQLESLLGRQAGVIEKLGGAEPYREPHPAAPMSEVRHTDDVDGARPGP